MHVARRLSSISKSWIVHLWNQCCDRNVFRDDTYDVQTSYLMRICSNAVMQ